MSTQTETFQFQAEARQVLDLMIHSLYTNKEIFLRELISNASDALDRLRVEALSNPDLIDKDDKLEIIVESDSKGRTITVLDNGVGMSRQEVIANIGTIAKSGTRELMQSLKEKQSPDALASLIGQFGVGFYSAFMAAGPRRRWSPAAQETTRRRNGSLPATAAYTIAGFPKTHPRDFDHASSEDVRGRRRCRRLH